MLYAAAAAAAGLLSLWDIRRLSKKYRGLRLQRLVNGFCCLSIAVIAFATRLEIPNKEQTLFIVLCAVIAAEIIARWSID